MENSGRAAYSKRKAQHGYVKDAPSAVAFDPVPAFAEREVGYAWGGRARLHLLVLAYLLWCARRSREESEIRYQDGTRALAEEFVFVTSIQTAAENIDALLYGERGRSHIEDAEGNLLPSFAPFYDRVKNAVRFFERKGWVRDLGFVQGDRLKGTRWTFGGTPLEAYAQGVPAGVLADAVDVRPRTKEVFLQAEAGAFRFAEACTGKRQRGRYLSHESWSAVVAEEGASQDRHVSVGSFRERDAHLGVTEETPCAIPYVVLEPERGDLVDRFDRTRRLLGILEADGADLSGVTVSYSGSESFHVRVPAGQFGSPVFRSVDAARRSLSRWAEQFEDELDSGLFDARHLVRMIGSRHEATGRYCTAFAADEFMGLSIAEIVDRSTRHEPYRMADPFAAPVSADLALSLVEAADSLSRFHIPDFDECPNRSASGALRRALEGVEEGETWHERHTGRNKAAYVVACHFAREHGSHLRGHRGSHQGSAAMDALREWNRLNTPPLPESDLRHCLRSAERTLRRETARH